jgi:hypothetical protein
VDTNEAEKEFEISPELKATLLESIAQGERGETISAEQLIQEMLDREPAPRDLPPAKPV